MKLKDGFVMRQVAGENVVLNVGGNTDFRGVMTLNATAATLWKRLEEEAEVADLVQTLLSEYEVDEKTAQAAAASFVETLKERDLLV